MNESSIIQPDPVESPEFQLLETLRWSPEGGYFLLDRHLARLAGSAAHFGYALNVRGVSETLAQAASRFHGGAMRVRLLVARDGANEIHAQPHVLPSADAPAWRVGVATTAVDPLNPNLFHKTTRRAIYQRARAECPGLDDVLLVNVRGEVTESTIANVVVERDGKRVTPPLACGLLPGTFRQYLLDRGDIAEGVVTVRELRNARKFFLINSVREWIPAELVNA